MKHAADFFDSIDPQQISRWGIVEASHGLVWAAPVTRYSLSLKGRISMRETGSLDRRNNDGRF
jgi:hypothetical protein